jgi:hypothetical protein
VCSDVAQVWNLDEAGTVQYEIFVLLLVLGERRDEGGLIGIG